MKPQHQERPDFRIITYDEYSELHDNPEARIKYDELEEGSLVEVYGTGPELKRNNIAFNFTSQIEFTDTSARATVGRIAIKFLVISGELLKPLPQYDLPAFVSPETPSANSSPLMWYTDSGRPIYFPSYGNMTHGFISSWVNSDAFEFLQTSISLSEEQPRSLTLV